MLNGFDLWFDRLTDAEQRLLYGVFRGHRATIEQQCKRGLSTGLIPCWQHSQAELDSLKRLVGDLVPGVTVRFIDVDSVTDESTWFYLLFKWPAALPASK